MATQVAKSFDGELLSTSIGQSAIGRFGKVTFRSEKMPNGKVWVHTQGPHNVMVTHLVTGIPDQHELDEAEQIVMSMSIAADNQPLQQTEATGIVSKIRKWFWRGPAKFGDYKLRSWIYRFWPGGGKFFAASSRTSTQSFPCPS